VKEHVYTKGGNLVLKMDKTVSPPEPEPEECEAEVTIDADGISYGKPCSRKNDRSACDCAKRDCYQSWSSKDPNGFLGKSGQCRCLPQELTQPAGTYSYGELARRRFEGQCRRKCKECRWSWPSSDPLYWKSDHLQARCMPALSLPEDSSLDY
jgi:hypothetical protein